MEYIDSGRLMNGIFFGLMYAWMVFSMLSLWNALCRVASVYPHISRTTYRLFYWFAAAMLADTFMVLQASGAHIRVLHTSLILYYVAPIGLSLVLSEVANCRPETPADKDAAPHAVDEMSNPKIIYR